MSATYATCPKCGLFCRGRADASIEWLAAAYSEGLIVDTYPPAETPPIGPGCECESPSNRQLDRIEAMLDELLAIWRPR